MRHACAGCEKISEAHTFIATNSKSGLQICWGKLLLQGKGGVQTPSPKFGLYSWFVYHASDARRAGHLIVLQEVVSLIFPDLLHMWSHGGLREI